MIFRECMVFIAECENTSVVKSLDYSETLLHRTGSGKQMLI